MIGKGGMQTILVWRPCSSSLGLAGFHEDSYVRSSKVSECMISKAHSSTEKQELLINWNLFHIFNKLWFKMPNLAGCLRVIIQWFYQPLLPEQQGNKSCSNNNTLWEVHLGPADVGIYSADGKIQWHPAITKCHSTEKNVRNSGVFVMAKTPL